MTNCGFTGSCRRSLHMMTLVFAASCNQISCFHFLTRVHTWFERLVIFVILLNCLTLGMYQPCKDAQGCTDTRCRVLAVLDHVVYGFFVMEMLVKVLAMGFLGKKGYIAEMWNRLDMFIIIAG